MGDAGLPILGHMIEMFRGGPDFILHLYRTRGPVLFADSPVLPAVAALGPDAAQAIYSNRTRTTPSRAGSRSSGRSSSAA